MDIIVCEIGGRRLGLPAECVEGVVSPHPVTPLPFVPAEVDGLVVLGGRVLAQVDLGKRLGLGAVEDAGVLTVVRTGHGVTALKVDRVHETVSADAEVPAALCAPPAAAGGDAPGCDGGRNQGRTAVTVPFAVGQIVVDGQPIVLLDPQRLGVEGVVGAEVDVGQGEERGPGPSAPGEAAGTEGGAVAGHRREPCLMVRTRGQRYAVPLHSLREVLGQPELARRPGSPTEVAGMATVRGRPVLALSLAALLGFPASGESFSFIAQSPIGPVAVMVEHIEGIALAGATDGGSLDGALGEGAAGGRCLIDRDGQRVAEIDLGRLIEGERLAALGRCLPRDEGCATARRLRHQAVEPMLAFLVGRVACALPLDQVRRVEGYRLPRPAGSQFAAHGVVETGGDILPVLDLRKAMGQPLATSMFTAFIVAKVAGRDWALVVDQLDRVFALADDAITPTAGAGDATVAQVGNGSVCLLDVERLVPG